MKELHVVTMYMHSPERLMHYLRFVDHMYQSGVKLYTIEVEPEGQPFRTSNIPHTSYWQLSTCSPQIWHKERAINRMIALNLPSDAELIAWIDADIIFCNPNWVETTIKLLRRWKIIQMFSHTMDLGPNWQPVGGSIEGFVHRYVNERPVKRGQEIAGLGWAARREVLGKLPLLDWMISSGADSVMARGFFGENKVSRMHTPAYKQKAAKWIKKSNQVVNGEVGYVQGLVLHCWHGPRNSRGYNEVERILIRDKFDPDTDIELGENGLYQFTGKNKILEQDMNEWYKRREGYDGNTDEDRPSS